MSEDVITTDQLNSILKKCFLGELVSPASRLTNGWTNITFKLITKPNGKTFILRQYLPGRLRKLSRENIEFELNFVNYLFNELDLPVAPMIDPPGVVHLKEQNYVVLFPFIEGIKYLDKPSKPVRQLWQTLQISRFLGQMHSNIRTNKYQLVPSNRCSVNFVDVKYRLVHCCDEFAKDCPDLYERIRRIIDERTKSIPLLSDQNQQNHFEKIHQENLPLGYIHADIHDDNVLFSFNEEKLVAVLDFDDMYIGPLLIDICLTLCLWCSIGSQFNFDYAKQFVRTYQQERQMILTEKEWNLLEIYCYLTILNQILFAIEAEKNGKSSRDTINELLLPIEQISRNEKTFLEKIREIE